ncbi:triphosphoribosyl-dephospho-CoA synthase MdcB [Mycolicibacterium sp. P9-64]|uniref:triphosphoribosyl-dephospho-CoA synthase n=1 Tax=Mycolicibacterium sp. P9-64 TaxID=2024612 RepID=UPI0011EEF092|nr:triphosphoribosyl-dephospho-CoA synthase [Mycolicibacterium sp. P9-64]KAA0081885.1 triphosphoribosyl-dephospho-CoA synthase MdcB [Mycolicibacterium sp. P9-64]
MTTAPANAFRVTHIADAAVTALGMHARLVPNPGRVEGRGASMALLAASAEVLREPLWECAEAARSLPLGRELRARLGEIGREGERRVRDVTGGVSTHRGALWTLGLLSAGSAVTTGADSAASFAALVARIPDPSTPARPHHDVRGPVGEARSGFPHVIRIGLPALRASRRRRDTPDTVALNTLIAIMAKVDDTCVARRGGPGAQRLVHRRARDILRAGGCGTAEGRHRLKSLCEEAEELGLSMGGSGDLLTATLFLDLLEQAA